jgi:hypothetical protein
MQCIVCHSNVVGPEILTLRTRLRKDVIVYHKSNGKTTMKKHVELKDNTLIMKFHQKQSDVASNNFTIP